MNVTRRPAASLTIENFDAETLALLEAVGVPLPDFGDIELDVAFGTPLEMYEPWATPRELARFEAGVGLKSQAERERELWAEFLARRCAALDIVAADPTVTVLVRERLVDVLLPYASQLNPASTEVSACHGSVTSAPLAA
ncbi:hypothetical protein ACFYXC_36575 [Streptomyces sp. NPDC002701]|uniref:hypothetical protein n=1 Tax=Streptomyces sp. NPDC002701 TaxID=3364661 RepID=UPI0036906EB1